MGLRTIGIDLGCLVRSDLRVRRRTVLLYAAVLVIAVAVSFVPWPIDIDPQIRKFLPAVLASLGIGIRGYARLKREQQMRRDFANYRCPFCRYFVDRDATACPNCGKAMTPVADG